MKHFAPLLFLLLSVQARGQLVFVNHTTETVYLTLTSFNQGVWTTHGWYRINALETYTAVQKPTNRYYYYYARSKSKTWRGKDGLAWVHNTQAFTTRDGLNYGSSKGYKAVGITMVDLGDDRRYTVNLDLRSDLVKQIEFYLKNNQLDPMEGLYTISDDIFIDHTGLLSPADKQEKKDHWAKVAIIRDTVSLSRNYMEFVIEAEGFNEGDVRADFLRANQGVNLFISDQVLVKGEPSKSVVFEFIEQDGIIEGKLHYKKGDTEYRVKRTYLKYFPQK